MSKPFEKKSPLEIAFEFLAHTDGLPEWKEEFRFHPKRRWRFDYAWPEVKVAVEIEGGVWTQGRHTRGRGFTEDAEKYNAAAEMGWLVFRYPADFISDGSAIIQIGKVLLEKYAQLETNMPEEAA